MNALSDQPSRDDNLESIVDSLPDRYLADVLTKKEPIVSSFMQDEPIELGGSHFLPLNRTRLLQTLGIRGFDESVHILYDFLNGRPCGVQAGTVVDTPVPRGILLTSDTNVLLTTEESVGLIPLELLHEQKWSYFSPLHALMQREADNASHSTLLKGMTTLSDSSEIDVDLSTLAGKAFHTGVNVFLAVVGALTYAPIRQFRGGNIAVFMVTYPRYMVIAPVGTKTVIVISGCPTNPSWISAGPDALNPNSLPCPSCHAVYVYRMENVQQDNTVLCQNCGKPIPVNPDTLVSQEGRAPERKLYPVPSDEVVTNLISTLARLSAIATSQRRTAPVESKIPRLGPLLSNLALYAATQNSESWLRFQVMTLHDLTSSACKKLPDVPSQPVTYEITAQAFGDIVGGSRYAPRTLKCSKCGALRNVSVSMIPSGGLVKCHNCGISFKASNYDST